MSLPTGYDARKGFPMMTFLAGYMPDAIEAMVELSKAGNVQHEITEPTNSPFFLKGDRIAWDRDKSAEELETLFRHLWDHARAKRGGGTLKMLDSDGVLHIVKTAWRACAEAQKTIEALRRAAHELYLVEIGPGRFKTEKQRVAEAPVAAQAPPEVSSPSLKGTRQCPACGRGAWDGYAIQHEPGCSGVGL